MPAVSIVCTIWNKEYVTFRGQYNSQRVNDFPTFSASLSLLGAASELASIVHTVP